MDIVSATHRESCNGAPGRNCPMHYRYSPESFVREPDLRAQTLYVIGGLYGNIPALEAVLALAEQDHASVSLVFNGDFNWFNVDGPGFVSVNEQVLRHTALRGNVETEIAGEDEGAGCGCAYPQWVGEAEVARSNEILQRLRAASLAFPQLRSRLSRLPMHLLVEIGGVRIAVVHGDLHSLAGWDFAQEHLADAAGRRALAHDFESAQVRVIASTHTCLPVVADCETSLGRCVLINNGAAGMPNFAGTRYGVITRISTQPARGFETLYGTRLEGIHVDALPVHYAHERWAAEFLQNWPAGSPAYDSYWRRISSGPAYDIGQAVRLRGDGMRGSGNQNRTGRTIT
jgi:predicted phosphodiesterase